jgi:hypothetical protein
MGSSWVLQNSWKNWPRMTRTYLFAINRFVKKHRSNNPSCCLQHIRHQLALDGARRRVNASSDYVACIPARETTHHQKRNANCWSISSSTADCRNQLQKRTLLARSHGCKAWIAIALQGMSFSSCVAVLALDFDTPVFWARRFSDFLDVCSSLAPVSFNFSVSTEHLCFVSCLLRVPLF